MPSYYTEQQIEEMNTRFGELSDQHAALHEQVVMRKFRTAEGDEFAKHGFMRRCDMLWRCVQKTFETIPPDLDELPSSDQTKDATIFLHCFIIHVFGACDDLAWVLVHEKAITRADGNPLPPAWIGFRKDNKIVRENLTKRMISVLDSFEKWFKHVDDFRHSLAHRIPLYVPQYNILADREDDYRRLEGEICLALTDGDLDKHQQLKQQQEELTFFRPWFTHSFSEKSPLMVIHAQMLADFGAVLELGDATIQEL